MDKNARVFVAGHQGMVGSAIVRHLKSLGFQNVVTRSRSELDLTNQRAVAEFFQTEAIDEVYLAAAKVGGIYANDKYPADFIYENLMIEANVIHQAYRAGVTRLLFLGSSCIYPKFAPQPIPEDALLMGKLEPTNEPYAIAKIAGIKLCESYNRQYGTDYRSVMPTNLYGPGDNYHPQNSHVVPALIRRMHEAKLAGVGEVTVWGTGTPRREFLYVDDLAAAAVRLMHVPTSVWHCDGAKPSSYVNVGTGVDLSIEELARLVARVVGYSGAIQFDITKPDGTPRKVLDVSHLHELGFRAVTSIEEGLHLAYDDFLCNSASRQFA